MSTNLDYLDPNLLPLEDKLNAYLAAEKELRAAEQERLQPAPPTTPPPFDQRPATGSYAQHDEETERQLQDLRHDLDQLRHEILALLPVRDEWVKVNLGYGPSRVGAFQSPDLPAGTYELRVVH